MIRPGAVLPGYANVARASEVLHLAPRSVRDLIYAGRLPSVRIGRLHYVRASDLELERRRRLGLPPRVARARTRRPRALRPPAEAGAGAAGAERAVSVARTREHADPALRQQRALQRAQDARRWAERHAFTEPQVPFELQAVTEALTCAACARQVRQGRVLVADGERLCLTCGRRALLAWADRRRLEAVAARRLSHNLGAAEPASSSVGFRPRRAVDSPTTLPHSA